MERTFSVDDLIGNVYRLSGALGGMGNRTDSEAAFQEFLKRIPSATNLSAIGSAGGAQYEPGALQQTAQQLLGNTSLPTAPLNTSLNPDPAPSMPRVPSLDLLRQLVLQNSVGNSQSHPTASAALKADPLSAAPLTAAVPAVSLSMTPAIDTSRYAPLGVPDLAAAAAAAANPLLGLGSASAAALQLRLASAAGAAQHADMKDDPNDKSETRRQRRMLSNRESARRSRKRKQEHMMTLEQQIDELNDNLKDKQVVVDMTERKCQCLEEENFRLREENDRLRDELRFLRTELNERKERSYYRRERSSDEDEDRYPPGGAKRYRGADAAPNAAASADRAAAAAAAAVGTSSSSGHHAGTSQKQLGAAAAASSLDGSEQELD